MTAFLLQRYHQDRVQTFDPETMPANLFEVLGTVTDFLSNRDPEPNRLREVAGVQ